MEELVYFSEDSAFVLDLALPLEAVVLRLPDVVLLVTWRLAGAFAVVAGFLAAVRFCWPCTTNG